MKATIIYKRSNLDSILAAYRLTSHIGVGECITIMREDSAFNMDLVDEQDVYLIDSFDEEFNEEVKSKAKQVKIFNKDIGKLDGRVLNSCIKQVTEDLGLEVTYIDSMIHSMYAAPEEVENSQIFHFILKALSSLMDNTEDPVKCYYDNIRDILDTEEGAQQFIPLGSMAAVVMENVCKQSISSVEYIDYFNTGKVPVITNAPSESYSGLLRKFYVEDKHTCIVFKQTGISTIVWEVVHHKDVHIDIDNVHTAPYTELNRDFMKTSFSSLVDLPHIEETDDDIRLKRISEIVVKNNYSSEKGHLCLISGSSGSGKTTMSEGTLSKSFKGFKVGRIVTMTTREKRPNEVDGVDYYFVSKEEFEKHIENDNLIEYADVYGNYYGATKTEVEDKIHTHDFVLYVIDVQGARTIRRLSESIAYLNDNISYIFVDPKDIDSDIEKIKQRADITDEEFNNRVAAIKDEYKYAATVDYMIKNDGTIAELVETLTSILICKNLEKH